MATRTFQALYPVPSVRQNNVNYDMPPQLKMSNYELRMKKPTSEP
jgi:hypothetical protein